MSVRPFKVDIPQAKLDWIKNRLKDAQWPTEHDNPDPWAYGASIPEMRSLVEYWLTKYDWRAREARMNQFPHFIASVEVERVLDSHPDVVESAVVGRTTASAIAPRSSEKSSE